MGGSQFQVIKIYANAKGIDLGKDITVVNANFAVARAQLEADRVEAALVIEPLASIIVKQNPDWHVIFNGAQGWKEITGEDGWEIVPAMRADAIAAFPTRRRCCSPRCRTSPASCRTTPPPPTRSPTRRSSCRPASSPPRSTSKRLHMIVKPAWEPATRKSITDMMERAVKAGFYQKMPDEKIIYAP